MYSSFWGRVGSIHGPLELGRPVIRLDQIRIKKNSAQMKSDRIGRKQNTNLLAQNIS